MFAAAKSPTPNPWQRGTGAVAGATAARCAERAPVAAAAEAAAAGYAHERAVAAAQTCA